MGCQDAPPAWPCHVCQGEHRCLIPRHAWGWLLVAWCLRFAVRPGHRLAARRALKQNHWTGELCGPARPCSRLDVVHALPDRCRSRCAEDEPPRDVGRLSDADCPRLCWRSCPGVCSRLGGGSLLPGWWMLIDWVLALLPLSPGQRPPSFSLSRLLFCLSFRSLEWSRR